MKSYLLDTDAALRPNGDSVFRRMESGYSAPRAFLIIVIADFQ